MHFVFYVTEGPYILRLKTQVKCNILWIFPNMSSSILLPMLSYIMYWPAPALNINLDLSLEQGNWANTNLDSCIHMNNAAFCVSW